MDEQSSCERELELLRFLDASGISLSKALERLEQHERECPGCDLTIEELMKQ